jgi:signal transduction histidine kinase
VNSESSEKRSPSGPKKSLAFFGAVTASVSHELNNVISIIDQSAGLMEDMIIGEEKGIPLSVERLSETVASIQKQAGRGLKIIQRLNRFAHSSDFPVTEFDLNETVSNLVELSRRLAGLRRADTEYTPVPVETKITGNPFLLQQALFEIIMILLGSAERGDIITVKASSTDSGAAIEASLPRQFDIPEDRLATVEEMAEALEGELTHGVGEDVTSMKISIPGKSRLK